MFKPAVSGSIKRASLICISRHMVLWRNTIASCYINLSDKGILWKYSIQRLKTAESFLLSMFMRDNGRCNIPNTALPATLLSKGL